MFSLQGFLLDPHWEAPAKYQGKRIDHMHDCCIGGYSVCLLGIKKDSLLACFARPVCALAHAYKPRIVDFGLALKLGWPVGGS